MCTIGPWPPAGPWIVTLPVIPLNSPVPPVTTPTAETYCGKASRPRGSQKTPDAEIVTDPVAPTRVHTIGSSVKHGVVLKSHVNTTVTVTDPMRFVKP